MMLLPASLNTRLRRYLQTDTLSSLVIMGMRMATLVAKFALTIFIAHVMGFTELGLYSLVVGATVIGTTVAGLGLMSLLVRDMVSLKNPEIPAVMRHYWLLPALVYVVALPVTIGVGLWQNQLALALFTWALVIIEHLNADAYSLLLNTYQPRAANILFFFRSAGWIFLFIPLAWLVPVFANTYVILSLWFAANLGTLIVFFMLTRSWGWLANLSGSRQSGWYKHYLTRSWMFYLSDICGMASLYLDRYLITFFLGLEKTGIYMLFWSVGNAVYGLINTGTLQIKRPHLIAAFNTGDTTHFKSVYRHVTFNTLGMSLLILVASGVVFPLLLPYLGKPEALGYAPLLWLLLAGVLARVCADLASYGLYARHFDKTYTISNMLALPVAALLMPLCIPIGGLYGAAAAGLITMALLCGGRIHVLNVMTRQPQPTPSSPHMPTALIVTGHFAAGGRKIDLHFIADELIAQGWQVNFLTIGLSRISKYKNDGRWQTAHQGPVNQWVTPSPNLHNFVWVAPFHPFNLRKSILNLLSTPVFKLYPYFLPSAALQVAKTAEIIIIESGLPPLLAPLLRAQGKAVFIYNAADRPTTLNVHPLVLKAEKNSLPLFSLIRAAAQALANDYPPPLPTKYIPHGLQKQLFSTKKPSPYTQKINAVSVGNMLFSPWVIQTLAKAFPTVTFHLFGGGVSIPNPPANVVAHGELPFEQLIPYLQHANVGIAPYSPAEGADYLSQSSLKMIQYTYCQLPIVAPHFAALGRPHVADYTPENETSLIAAFTKALNYPHKTIDTSSVLDWTEVTTAILKGART